MSDDIEYGTVQRTTRERPCLAIETLQLIIDLCVELSVTSASVAPFPLF